MEMSERRVKTPPIDQQLSELQQHILQFVQEYIHRNEQPPGIRVIREGVGMHSTSNVLYHINRLVDRGHLKKEMQANRTLVVLNSDFEQLNTATPQALQALITELRLENNRLREWCRQVERERAWERTLRQSA